MILRSSFLGRGSHAMLYYIRLCFTSINRSPLWLWLRTCCGVPRHVTMATGHAKRIYNCLGHFYSRCIMELKCGQGQCPFSKCQFLFFIFKMPFQGQCPFFVFRDRRFYYYNYKRVYRMLFVRITIPWSFLESIESAIKTIVNLHSLTCCYA